jgi:hypothetical protein
MGSPRLFSEVTVMIPELSMLTPERGGSIDHVTVCPGIIAPPASLTLDVALEVAVVPLAGMTRLYGLTYT